MAKQIQILLAGVLVVVPIAATVWVVSWLATAIDQMGSNLLNSVWGDLALPPMVGIVVIVVLLYFVGLLTRMWIFSGLFRMIDRLLSSVPGVKAVYESIRDLLKLFGGDADKMGKVVLYRQPATDLVIMGIMTNSCPVGVDENTDQDRVAVYQPFAYMFGGPVIYVPREHVTEIDMTVEQALKLATTAHVGAVARKVLSDSQAQSCEEKPSP
ncbi:MAG: DUF502 domain-containing protein [Phycisphaerae bacterium]